MSVLILDTLYDINIDVLCLYDREISKIPESIGNLVKLQCLSLTNNQLKNLPTSILNIKNSLYLDIRAYEINNLQVDTEFLIFSWLGKELTNLPTELKELWIETEDKKLNHKLPFGCVIKYF